MTDLDAIKLHSMAYERGKTETLDEMLKIIDEVEHTEGLSKADEYGLLRMKIAKLKDG